MDRAIINQVIQAADGKIVGRIRIQKIFYLLEHLGLESGLRYSYHHYGPYSEELARELDYAKIIDGSISEDIETTNFGANFSIYKCNKKENFTSVGGIEFRNAEESISSMKNYPSVIIELAATIHWLVHKEKIINWTDELKIRKPNKAGNQNIEQAIKLLRQLNLADGI